MRYSTSHLRLSVGNRSWEVSLEDTEKPFWGVTSQFLDRQKISNLRSDLLKNQGKGVS